MYPCDTRESLAAATTRQTFSQNTTAYMYMYMYFIHPATSTKERARGRHAGCEWAMQVRHAFLHACIDGALVWPRVTEIPGWRV